MSEHRELYGKELDPKVLSNLILIKRTDRPDEWGMDELSRKAFELEKENAELKAENEKLKVKARTEEAIQKICKYINCDSCLEINLENGYGGVIIYDMYKKMIKLECNPDSDNPIADCLLEAFDIANGKKERGE